MKRRGLSQAESGRAGDAGIESRSPTQMRRAVTAEDHGALYALQSTILPQDIPCNTASGAWWLLIRDGEPAAFAGVMPSKRWTDCMYLCRAGVLPEHRGRGLQRRLILVRERYAKQMGMAWLISDTTDNPASANSLIARGFKLYEPASPWGGKKTLYWRKRLP